MWPKLAAAAAVIVALGCATPVAAAVTIYTYTGTVSAVSQYTNGVLGSGPDLVGRAFTAVFRVDDAAPGARIYQYAGSSMIEGGNPNSAVLATFTTDGESPMTFGTNLGRQYQVDGASEEFGHASYDIRETHYGRTTLYQSRGVQIDARGAADYLHNADYHSLPSLTAAGTPDFAWSGRVVIVTSSYDLNAGIYYSSSSLSIGLAPTSLTVSTAAVPEPAAWALMLTGFFGAGAVIRSRRRAVARAGQPAR